MSDALDEDWGLFRRPRTTAKSASDPTPDLNIDEDWATLSGLPSMVYFLYYQNTPGEAMAMPQLWSFHVSGRRDGYYVGRLGNLLWSMHPLNVITRDTKAVMISAAFNDLPSAQAALIEVRETYVRGIQFKINDAREQIHERQEFISEAQRAIALLNGLDLRPSGPVTRPKR